MKKTKKKKFKIIFIVEFILIIIVGCALYFIWSLDRIPKKEVKVDNIEMNEIDNQNLEGYRNIALFGVDSRANDLEKNTRTDSIMVASVNRKTKKVKVVSIYRDTYVNIPNNGYNKLNHAYSYGGPELAISTINRNFDLDIKEFVTVNFSAVGNVINKLGGVTINISQEEFDYVNDYIRDVNKINGTNSPYLTTTGEQVLDGTQAVAYCRVRYTSGGDFTRAERQRTVITQILKEAKSSNIATLLSIVQEMIPQIYTSLSTTEILSLAKDIFAYDLEDTTGFPMDTKGGKLNGIYYTFADTLVSNVIKLHEFLFEKPEYNPSSQVQEYSNTIASSY